MRGYSHRTSAGGRISQGQRSFAGVPAPSVPRSVFNRDSQLMTGLKAGDLIPIFRDEVTPGDTINMSARIFGRLEPTIRPIMSGLYVDVFFFAVPHRLVWENWEKMHGSQDNPGDSTDFLAPVLFAPGLPGFGEESIQDFMGVPPIGMFDNISAMWFRAYNLIWNDHFRDETLQDSVEVRTNDGPDNLSFYSVLKRGKRHDYFTSANPFVQKGSPVELPLGGTAPVVGAGAPEFDYVGTSPFVSPMFLQSGPAGVVNAEFSSGPQSALSATMEWADPKLEADLSGATAATVNDLRDAIALQQVLEKDARGGTRYTEMIKAHFGVDSEDMRLQRPELLGLGTLTVNPHVVPNTAALPGQPVGQVHSFSTVNGMVNFTRSFTEHCMIIGLACLRSDLLYQQGIHRDFSRRDRYDWPLPGLAHLGEQPILNKEIFADASANDDLVFGYQERYAERRYKPSEVTGIMRSQHSIPQDFHHLAQDFATLPVLDSEFIEEDPPMNRVFALQDAVQLLLNAWFSYKHAQPLPVYGVPGLNRL